MLGAYRLNRRDSHVCSAVHVALKNFDEQTSDNL